MSFVEMDLQPNLKGKIIHLRPIVKTDFEPLYLIASDPLVWEQHPQPNRFRKDVFQTYFDDAIKSKGALFIEDIASGKAIGSSRFYEADLAKKSVVIGYSFLGRDYWGGAYNRELKYLMLRHAFEFVEKVHFHIGDTNFRSRKAIEKIGAKIIEQIPIQDKVRIIYEIDKPTFLKVFT